MLSRHLAFTKCNFCLFPTESLDFLAPDVKFPDRWRQRTQSRYKNKKFYIVQGIKIILSNLNSTRSCGYFGMPYPILWYSFGGFADFAWNWHLIYCSIMSSHVNVAKYQLPTRWGSSIFWLENFAARWRHLRRNSFFCVLQQTVGDIEKSHNTDSYKLR